MGLGSKAGTMVAWLDRGDEAHDKIVNTVTRATTIQRHKFEASTDNPELVVGTEDVNTLRTEPTPYAEAK